MVKRAKNPGGYLTVFLSLSLPALLFVILFLIEAALINHSKLKLEIATDIGINSALSEYHRELLAQYDLLFIDMSYGTKDGQAANVEGRLDHYIGKNIEPEAGTVAAWNGLGFDGASITAGLAPHHFDGKILKRQIAEYVARNQRADLITDLGNMLADTKELDGKQAMAEWESVMGNIATILTALTKSKRQEALELDPEADVSGINVTLDNPADASFADARQVFGDIAAGDGRVDLKEYYSHRPADDRLKTAGKYDEGLVANLATDHLLRCYLFEKMGYYKQPKDGSLLSYQIEYILAGKDTDDKNLKAIRLRLLAWRFADNVRLYYSTEAKKLEAQAIALAITALAMSPELEPLVTNAILLGWAYGDAKEDVDTLFDGGKIPLIKKDFKKTKDGFTYPQYLELMLMLQFEKNTLARTMDIMEMDIRLTPGNRYFRIDRCLEALQVTARFRDRFQSYEITRRYGYY